MLKYPHVYQKVNVNRPTAPDTCPPQADYAENRKSQAAAQQGVRPPGLITFNR